MLKLVRRVATRLARDNALHGRVDALEERPQHAALVEQLSARVAEVERRLEERDRAAALAARVKELEEAVFWRGALFYKAFEVAGLWGDYVEFGVYSGATMSNAWWCAKRHLDLFASGAWDHSLAGDRDATKRAIADSFRRMRFIGFDSFEGIPPAAPGENAGPFAAGTYAAAEEVPRGHLARTGVDMGQVHFVKGFFNETCTPQTAAALGLREIAVLHIDSDLYSSALTALDFCTPFLRDGSVVIFDEWFQFNGSPVEGEQRAFAEWRERNPDWNAQELAREATSRMGFVLNRRRPADRATGDGAGGAGNPSAAG
ncbi:TylF/MycF/NovP-related O-methyltransferase [Falsiroseomonas sp. CW058]|uniref:TylF/MycF/NovP-related O-methyltransferase n=1 Tax=Falsiroseomonas sp. CW058 TaxID=3388664 RepID=UPI003D31C445